MKRLRELASGLVATIFVLGQIGCSLESNSQGKGGGSGKEDPSLSKKKKESADSSSSATSHTEESSSTSGGMRLSVDGLFGVARISVELRPLDWGCGGGGPFPDDWDGEGDLIAEPDHDEGEEAADGMGGEDAFEEDVIDPDTTDGAADAGDAGAVGEEGANVAIPAHGHKKPKKKKPHHWWDHGPSEGPGDWEMPLGCDPPGVISEVFDGIAEMQAPIELSIDKIEAGYYMVDVLFHDEEENVVQFGHTKVEIIPGERANAEIFMQRAGEHSGGLDVTIHPALDPTEGDPEQDVCEANLDNAWEARSGQPAFLCLLSLNVGDKQIKLGARAPSEELAKQDVKIAFCYKNDLSMTIGEFSMNLTCSPDGEF